MLGDRMNWLGRGLLLALAVLGVFMAHDKPDQWLVGVVWFFVWGWMLAATFSATLMSWTLRSIALALCALCLWLGLQAGNSDTIVFAVPMFADAAWRGIYV
jgi:hypothetical protein